MIRRLYSVTHALTHSLTNLRSITLIRYRYGSGLLGSLGLKERTAETSLSLDMINGSDEDSDENDLSKDEALLPL